MESDFFFNFKSAKAFSGWPGLVSRMTVLRSLFGRSKGRARIIKHTQHCLYAWRARASEFAAVGAHFTRRRDWEKRARNCQPAFVVGSGYQWTCGTATVCPFCYAREVAKLWKIAEASFRPFFGLAEGASPYWILERRHRGRFTFLHIESLLLAYRGANSRRRILAKQYQAVGGYGCLRVEPTKTPCTWSFSGRQLFKVPAGGVYAATSADEKIIVHQTPTPALLCAALARTCRYPKSLLRGPVAEVAAILDFQSNNKIRTSSLLGDFRANYSEFDDE